ncbi:ADP-ribosylglycohydrolase family protein [Kitasatospora sp. NPDC028055]|uniref:ADP-ribosylglycohydrolase family protein n=1 Tax=Kitasatospora sp. NPDC028055 TaxID=3155653 RepID=UPI0033DE1947
MTYSAAREALEGLALGDGFGERWFPLFRTPKVAFTQIRARQVPPETPWHWTDDTAMALSVYGILTAYEAVHQERLAQAFGATYLADAYRGYGNGMSLLLPRLAGRPSAWREESRRLFDGQGSLGNGAAMRAAPLGAWFHADLDEAAEQAALSAEVTHAHPEGIAGAVAVALAAALAARGRGGAGAPAPAPAQAPAGAAFLAEVAGRTPAGPVREGLARAAELAPDTEPWRAADLLGNGQRVRAGDTVPFALWSAAHHLDSLTDALWTTAEGLGDVDTTCAITGGVVAARTGLDGEAAGWLARREPLPEWVAGAEDETPVLRAG